MGAVRVAVVDHRLEGAGLSQAIARRLILQAGGTRIRVMHPDDVPFRPAADAADAKPAARPTRRRNPDQAEAEKQAQAINAYWARSGHDAGAMAVPIHGGAHGNVITGWRVETRNLVNGAPVRRMPAAMPARARAMTD